MKYAVIGGNPFRGYTGTLSYTSLQVVGTADCKEEVKSIVEDNYDDCGGLLLVIDLETGEEADL